MAWLGCSIAISGPLWQFLKRRSALILAGVVNGVRWGTGRDALFFVLPAFMEFVL